MYIRKIAKINKESIRKNNNRSEYLYLETGEITKNNINEIIKYSNFEELPSRAKRIVKDKDIIISTVRPIQEHYGILINPDPNLLVSTGFTVLTVNPLIANPFYIYYYLTSKKMTRYFQMIATSSVSSYPSITSDIIGNVKMDLPTIEYQDKVVKEIRLYEDKIMQNHKLIKNINELLGFQFEKTFIKFENKKISSDNLNQLPEGWTKISIKDFLTFQAGTEPGTSNYVEPGAMNSTPFIRVRDMGTDETNVAVLSMDEYIILGRDDIIVSLDGTLGKIDYNTEGTFSSGIRLVNFKDNLYGKNQKGYILALLNSRYFQQTIKRFATGSTILHAEGALSHLFLNIPDDRNLFSELISEYSSLFKHLIELKEENKSMLKIKNNLVMKYIVR